MQPHRHLRHLRAFTLASGVVFSSLAGAVPTLASDEAGAVDTGTAPEKDPSPEGRPAATFFSISDVLAKLDRQGGQISRGSGAVQLAAYAPSDVVTDVQPALKAAPAIGKEPFGLFTFRAPDGLLWRKWKQVEADLAKDRVTLDHCRADLRNCPSHAAQFLRLVDTVKSKSGRARIEEANRGINIAIRYVSDLSHHGELDRWSSPLATFAAAKGDCEDYAIAKYGALIEAGVPRDDLQIVLVRDRSVRQDHAVLAARHEGRWLLLDNRWSGLTEDGDATRFAPLFAINHDGVHLFAAPYAKRMLPDDKIEAAPAASRDPDMASWTGADPTIESASGIGRLPLLL